MGSEAMVLLSKFRGCCCGGGLVLHLLKELVGWILVSILLHLGEVALLRGHRGVNLESRYETRVYNTVTLLREHGKTMQ